nr:MMPL family transporter [Rhodoligotrophos defluvii]
MRTSMDHPWSVIVAAVVICCTLAVYAYNTLGINVDTNDLFSRDAPFLQAEDRFNELFPSEADQILVVIDGPSKAKADQAANQLVARLEPHDQWILSIQQPGGGPFFRRNGLLYLTPEQLAGFIDQLTKAQPILGTLSANPSLVGLLDVVSLIFQGASMGEQGVGQSHAFLNQVATGIESGLAGEPATLDWGALLGSSLGPDVKPRAFVLVHPKLDPHQLMPGKPASDLIRTTARELGLTPENGYRVRLTGSVPLSDEEFATVESGSWTAITLSVVLVTVILALALGSWKLIVASLFTLGMGLLATMGWAAASVGVLNLISIGFTVMFVGIAIDFGIQFCMRLREERYRVDDFQESMVSTTRLLARPLLLAAVATAAGFFSFLPTSYRGVAELGVIAGGGILIAFLLTMTLLPALLSVLQPGPEARPVGFEKLRPLGTWLVNRRKPVLAVFALLSLATLAGLFMLRFDFDPLDLKDPESESMSTLMELAEDPLATPYTLNVLVSGPDQVRPMVERLEALPEVRNVMSIFSFVPEEQERKQEMLQNVGMMMGPAMQPPQQTAPPSAEDIRGAIDSTLAQIRTYLESGQTEEPIRSDAQRLQAALNRLSAVENPDRLQAISAEMTEGFGQAQQMLGEMLQPEQVTVDKLPEDLRSSWIANNGQYRLQVFPSGNPRQPDELVRFVEAVRSVDPQATGMPITIYESSSLVINAFITAAILAAISITILLWLTLRNIGDVARTLTPLFLATLWTLGLSGLIGMELNFANIIGLPLLLGLGVTFPIYLVHAWRRGEGNLIAAPVARAVLFSALTTLASFGSLALSSHPGTSQLGLLLSLALGLLLISTFIFLPPMLGRPPEHPEEVPAAPAAGA